MLSNTAEQRQRLLAQERARFEELKRAEQTGQIQRPYSQRRLRQDRRLLSERSGAIEARLIIERDASLQRLETCAAAPVGVIRLLRSELLANCAMTLLGPWLNQPPAGLDEEGYAVVRGLLVAERLDELAFDMPAYSGPLEAPLFSKFVERRVRPWQTEQLARIAGFDAVVHALPEASYGALLARTAQALSAYRLVAAHRAAPIPDALKKRYVPRSAYYAAIDQAAGPAQELASALRQGALRTAQQLGVIDHPRLTQLLRAPGPQGTEPASRLLLPKPSALVEPSADASLVRQLPSFYAARLLPATLLTERELLASLAPRGLPLELRRHLNQLLAQNPTALGEEQRLEIAEGWLRLGLLYGAPELFRRARSWLPPTNTARARFLGAMLEAVRDAGDTGQTLTALESLAASTPNSPNTAQDSHATLEAALAEHNLAELLIPHLAHPSPELTWAVTALGTSARRLTQLDHPICVDSSWRPFKADAPCPQRRPWHWLGRWDGFTWHAWGA